MKRISAAGLLLFLAFHTHLAAQTITTIAGSVAATDGLKARETPLVFCRAAAADRNGVIYIADDGSRVVRRIDPVTSIATVFAGSGPIIDDLFPVPAKSAFLNLPAALAGGPDNSLYIADDANYRVRRVDPSGRIITVAGSGVPGFLGDGEPATRSQMGMPRGIAVDPAGNLYIIDDQSIRKVEASSGIIRTLAGGPFATGTGDGIPAKGARIQLPGGIAADADGNVFFSDTEKFVIRKIEASTGLIRTVAGNGQAADSGDGGPATAASLRFPSGLAVAANGDLFVGQVERVRRITPSGTITTVLGGGTEGLADGRLGTQVWLRGAQASHLSMNGSKLLVALPLRNIIVQLDLTSGTVAIIAGDSLLVGDGGPAKTASLAAPSKLALDRATGKLYIADSGHHRIRLVMPGTAGPGTGTISTVAGIGVSDTGPDGSPASTTPVSGPQAVAVDSAGNLYFTDNAALVRRVGADGLLQTVAGSMPAGYGGDGGPATLARLLSPAAVAVDSNGTLYIADIGNNRVRQVDAAGIIRTIAGTGAFGYAGDGGPATAAQFKFLSDLLLDGRGGLLLADSENHRVRRVDLATGRIVTVAGIGRPDGGGDGGPATAAAVPLPYALGMDGPGNLYIAGPTTIRRIDAATGRIMTLAGGPDAGFGGDEGLAALARLRSPSGIVLDGAGNLIFTDSGNHRVRRISMTGGAAADLAVNPTSFTFFAIAGGDPPPPFPLQIMTRNLIPTPWSAAVTYESGSGWLNIGFTTGGTPAALPVGVKTAGLAAGTYAATVTIVAPGAANSPQAVKITLSLTAGGEPKLAVDHQSILFRAKRGGSNPPAEIVNITNAGGGSLRWSVIVQTRGDLDWLSVSPVAGEGSATVTISARTGSLASGVYQGLVAFLNQANNRPTEVPVTFIVSEAAPSLLLSHLGTLFVVNEGGSYVPPDTVQVLNVGDAEMSWQATAGSLSGGDWLAVSPTSGRTAAGSSSTMQLSARPGGLRAGVYAALVTVSGDGALNSPQLVLAQIIVQEAGSAPAGIIRPGGLALIASSSGSVQQGSLSVSTSGGAALNYVAGASTSDGGSWLSVSPLAGTLQGSAERGTLTVQANPSGLAVGAYYGRVTISFSNNSAQDVSVLFIVTPGASASAAGLMGAAVRQASCTPSQQFPLHTALTNNFNLPAGWATPILVQVLDNCGSAVANSAVAVSFTNGDDALVLRSIGNGIYSGMWSPGRSGSTSIGVLATGGGLQAGKADPITGVVGAAGTGALSTPLIYRNGAVHGASFKRYAPLAPGQIFSLFGKNLAAGQTGADSIPLPNSLGGISATMGGMNLPLYYADTGQVNAQVPFDLASGNTLPLIVKSSSTASPPELVTLSEAEPGIFTVNSSGSGAGVVTDATGALISESNPARAGDVVIVYATGLGTTKPRVASGQASPSSPPAQTVSAVTAYIGGQRAGVEFAGLTPGLVGLYQVNVRIPADVQAGNAVELYLEQSQSASNKVTIAVKP